MTMTMTMITRAENAGRVAEACAKNLVGIKRNIKARIEKDEKDDYLGP